jgi:hypothetical protein
MGLPKLPLRMMFPLQHAGSNPNREEKFKIPFSETISHNPNLQSTAIKELHGSICKVPERSSS